jgi:hypothetical protein
MPLEASFEAVLAAARALSEADQRRLAAALGPRASLEQLAAFANRPPAPQSVAWVKAERGHAVLATDTGPADAEIPEGAAAIAGMWRDAEAAA